MVAANLMPCITLTASLLFVFWMFVLRINNARAVEVMLCMKFAATQCLLVKMHILERHLNPYFIVYDSTVDLVTMEMIQQYSGT